MPAMPMVHEDYEAQYDMETLMRAKEIEKNPARLAKAQAHAAAKAAKLMEMSGKERDSSDEMLMKGYRSAK